MAIVKMNKISIIGLNSEKSLLLRDIMDLGVVEISSQDSKLTDTEWMTIVKKDGNDNEVLNYDAKISKVSDVLDCLERYDTSKRPLFSSKKSISTREFEEKLSNIPTIEKNVNQVLDFIKKLNDLSSEENKIEATIMSLKPWVGYDIPLELSKTRYTNILMGIVPSIVEIAKLKEDLEQKTNNIYFNLISSDRDQHYISIICMTKEKEEVFETLKQYGFNVISFKDLQGTIAENIVLNEKRLKEISEEKAEIEKRISELVPYKEDIQLFYDHLIIERDKNKILENMLKTDSIFYIEGWMPEESKEKLDRILNNYNCWYEVKEPEKDEKYPVLLKNNSLVEPLEAVTELYSLPSSSNIDPTSSMWLFFILFFGMMLGDVGYGLMLVVGCGVVLKKYEVTGNLGKMLKTLFYTGFSTIFFGLMFGSFFGDGITAAAKLFFNVDFVMKPLWVNPMEEPMNVLIASFVFGLIHLFVGLGVKGYILIRDRQIFAAVFDVGFWYLFIIGPILLLLGGSFAVPGKYITIIGAVGLILTQGREKKGIISKLISGVLSLYDITGYLSDVLSYSRLLALGLATGVISSVLSIIGSMGGRSFFGIILFLAVFIFGHLFNFAINALGSFVHSARLQYVEYFGKFYEGGGEAFNPLIKNTKYFKINKEEE